MIKLRAALSLFLAAVIFSLAGCSFMSGIINIALPDYAAENPEIIEPGFVDYRVCRGYYKDLNENAKTAYRCIYNSIFTYPSQIEIPEVTQEELSEIFQALKYDNPHIIFLSSECSASTSGGRCYFLPKYSIDAATANQRINELFAAAKELTEMAEADSSEYYTQLFIHDSLCALCIYDGSALNGNTAYGALVERKALCMGYSYAYKLLLDMAGIQSVIVAGSAKNEMSGETLHMWNAVNSDGSWYHTDTTWDDPAGQDDSSNGEVRHCYFNLNDSEILNNHTVTDIPFEVSCTSSLDGYYRREGLFCDNPADAYELVRHTVVSVAANGDIMAEFRFNSGQGLAQACEQLFENGGMYEILKQAWNYGAVNIDRNFIRYTVVEKLNVLIVFLQYTSEDMM